MAEVGATIPRQAASQAGYHSRQRDDGGFIDRFRKPVVAASLISGDVVAAIIVIWLCRALAEIIGMKTALDTRYLPIVLLILTFFCVGLYAGCGPSPYERFRLRMIGIAGFVAIDLPIGIPVGNPGLFLVVEVLKAIHLLIFGHYIEAVIRTQLIHFDVWGASTALVGCGDNSRKLAHLLMHQPALGLTPIGFIETSRDRASAKSALSLPLIGATANRDCIRPHVEFLIFNSAEEFSALTADSRFSCCRFLLVKDVDDIQSLWLPTRMLGGAIGIEIRRDHALRYNQLIKRVIDILFAIPIALLVWPIIAVLALAVKFVDPGPMFYVQERVGHKATLLRIFKIRTMYVDAERYLKEHLSRDQHARAEWQRFFKLRRDPRVLPIIGNFMRRTSLDELPQLWNVIRGDMSLVGPRPFPAYHMSNFDDEFRAIRVSVQPGITGMWQVSSRSNGDLQVQKAQDLFYIRNWSIWLDMYILLQTLPAVLGAKGAR
jgi:Undecaprenyl-phosphate galactose phosphotransferase WbaP